MAINRATSETQNGGIAAKKLQIKELQEKISILYNYYSNTVNPKKIRKYGLEIDKAKRQLAKLEAELNMIQLKLSLAAKSKSSSSTSSSSSTTKKTTSTSKSTNLSSNPGTPSWIYLSWGTEKNDEKFKLPVSPQEVQVKTAAMFAKHTIIGLGEIQVPNGSEQTTISWEAMLPVVSENVGYIAESSEFKDPNYVIGKMEFFRKNKTSVRLTIEGMYSGMVKLSSFTYKKGQKGDFTYNIEWITAEESSLNFTTGGKSKSNGSGSGSSSGGTGGKRTAKAKKNPYPAKKGQTLYKLSKKLYGSGKKWKTLYKKNKKKLKKAGIGKKKTTKLKKNMSLKW